MLGRVFVFVIVTMSVYLSACSGKIRNRHCWVKSYKWFQFKIKITT